MDTGGLFSGAASITAPNGVVHNGAILAQGGTLTVSSLVTGTGRLQDGAGATLSLTVSGHVPDMAPMAFVGAGGTPQLTAVTAPYISTSTLQTNA